jgi:hypothetical protein
MTYVRWTRAVLMTALTCGCSSSSSRAVDAGRDATAAPDAPTSDGHTSDGRQVDDASRDARPGDGTLPDARPTDGSAVEADTSSPYDVGADAPSVTMISVSPQALHPAFSTSTHDYYVKCAAGANALEVTMTAASGSTIALTQPDASAPSSSATMKVDVNESQAIVVSVATGVATDEYWIRCLPHNFPVLNVAQHPDAGTPTPGYYLLGDFVAATGNGSYAMMLDGNGVPVWYSPTKGGHGALNVDSLEPGTVSWVPYLMTADLAPLPSQYQIHDLDAGTAATVDSVDASLDMHELQRLPNGNYIVLTAAVLSGVDLTGLKSYGKNESIYECGVQEITPDGQLVWHWSASEHFDPAKDSTWPVTIAVDGGTIIDTYHCNSIDVDADGNLLVSARHMDSIFLISRATGQVIWKMGGSTYSRDDAGFIAVRSDPLTAFYRQHDVRLQPNGQVSMYDDHTGIVGGIARAVVYSYSVDAGTASMVWQYKGLSYALAMGSFRILADGSRVIGWGVGAAQPFVFSEVDEQGHDLLDIGFDDGEASYRAVKVPASAFDIGLLRRAVGQD